ncbi:hypothetical protein NDU88_005390 [Pleurodeles waltl]|uniref:Uncharacterized protein n=1 Tax=Pleurodeles waltl TaxID=8319 RepID=A0AAV7PIE5_PLEWA|nr:hypothetical protein NDU88_005390 [Pleurodeles waltl]
MLRLPAGKYRSIEVERWGSRPILRDSRVSIRPSKGCQSGRHRSPAPSPVPCAEALSAPKATVQPGVATPTRIPQLAGSKRSPPGPRSSRHQAQKAAGEVPASRPKPPPTPLRDPDRVSGPPASHHGSSATLPRAAVRQQEALGGCSTLWG